ncbi:MAG: hypothetical protein H7Y07_08485, partial [Pyrinomonadaceae bacterium]|nr:hypothetical protein [Sphingobacteriaceae bacterium]
MKTFKNLAEYNSQWEFPAPLSDDFAIQKLHAPANTPFPPMQSSAQKFYSLGLYQDLDIEIKNGFSKFQPKSPFIFVKVPHQIFSWQVKKGPVNGWVLMFTESFLINHKVLNTIVQEFSFLRADHSGPFEIDGSNIQQLH